MVEVPSAVVEHVRGYLGMSVGVEPAHDSERTAKRHRSWVRQRLGVVYGMELARKLAERMIADAAQTKDNPADLINVALEELVRARLELPAYSTLDTMAARVRTEVNAGFHALVYGRITAQARDGLLELLRVDPVTRRSRFDDLKRTAGAATLSRFKEHLTHLAWLDSLGSTAAWVADVPPAGRCISGLETNANVG